MDNTFVFSDAAGYDMVVAVTEKTINEQIKTLASPDVGIIKTEIVVQMSADPKQRNKYVPMVMDSWDKVPKDVNGLPVNVCMRADYMPAISITSSGTNAALILNFTGGEFYMRDFGSGNINPAIDMSGWVFGIIINLDFADIERHPNAPQFVIDQLNHFTSDMFRVSQLFLNFERSDLTRFDPSVTSVGPEDDSVKVSFVYLMSSWLKYFKDNAAQNPFILGYAITRTDKSNDTDMGVPDSLKPIGNTFNVCKDPVAGKSTVNFILNTYRVPHKDRTGQHNTPGNFANNWIGSTEDCRAKMIYSFGAFLEDLILKPFYEQYRKAFYDQIKAQMDSIHDDSPYDIAKTVKPRLISYAVHNEDQGDNQYHNNYNVAWAPLPGTNGVSITWTGSWRFRKYKLTHTGAPGAEEPAEAWAEVSGMWNANMSIQVALNDQGRPILKPSTLHVDADPLQTDHWENGMAKAIGLFTGILGGFIDIFSSLFHGPDFTRMIGDALGGRGPDIKAVNISEIKLENSINTAFLLPAGDVFDFKNFSMLDTGESCLQLTYKAETGGSTTTSPTSSKLVENKVSIRPALLKKNLVTTPQTSNLAAPFVDKLQLQSLQAAKAIDTVPIDLSVSCELMRNTALGLPVSLEADINIVQDDKGNTHLSSVGSDGKLNLLVAASGSTASGWSVNDLTAAYTEHSKCVAFDIYQDQHGRVSFAFALKRVNGTASDVFYASNLPSQNLTDNLVHIQAHAKPIAGIDSTFVPERIRFGSTDDGQAPMLSVEGSLGFNHMWYQINSGSTTVSTMEFPQNVDQGGSNIVTQRSGFAFSSRANYFLYNASNQRQLVAQAVDSDGSAGNMYDYSPGNTDLPSKYRNLSYNTIEVATSRPDPNSSASDLYIGAATGLYRIPNGKHALMEAVTEIVKDIHMVSVVVDGNSLSVWALTAGNALYYIHGQRQQAAVMSTTVAWNSPVLFAPNVISLAAIRSVYNKSNELFVLTQDSSIIHYWQDPNSTLWQSRTASVPHSKYVIDFDSFTTHIHLESGGTPLSNHPLRVTCSEWQYYTINGLFYSLDEDVAAQVKTDDFGNLTMIAGAQGIATHVLHIQGDSFAETINVYPSGKIQYHLQHVNDGKGLRDAKQQDGKPVIDPATSEDVSDGVATQISTLHGVANDQYPPTKAGNVFTVAEHPSNSDGKSTTNLKHSLLQNIATPFLPKGTVVGATVMNGGLDPMPSHAVERLLHASKALKFSFNPIDIAGDIWHHIESIGGSIVSGLEDGLVKLDNGIHFVISHLEDGLTFVLHLVNGVVKIALKSLALVFKALNYILKLVGIDISKLLRWLGHLFGWDDIWDTHKVIAGHMRDAVNYAATHGIQFMDGVKSTIDRVFDSFDETVKNALLPDDVAKANLTQAKISSESQTTVPINSPQMNFATYHVNQSQPESDTGTSDTHPHLGVLSLYDDFLKPLASTFMDKMGRNAEDALHLLTHGSVDDIKRVLFDVVDTMIAMVKHFIDSLLELAKQTLGTLQDLLESDLDIPIVGAIYEFVTALLGEEESFTLVNGISFIIAIPITVVMKCASLGSFADTDGAKTISSPNGVTTLVNVATAIPGPQALKTTVRAIKDDHIRPVMFLQASAAETVTVDRKWAAAAASQALIAQVAAAADSLVAVPPKPSSRLKKIRTGTFLVKQITSVPWWTKTLGKNDTIVGLRYVRWIFGFLGFACIAGSDDPKNAAYTSLFLGTVGMIFTFAIDGKDPPAKRYKDEVWGADMCVNIGNWTRALGSVLVANGEPVVGGGGMVLGALTALAGSGMGMHLAIENLKDKGDQQDFGQGFEGFVAAALNVPLC